MTAQVFKTVKELNDWRAGFLAKTKRYSVGFVPTMGALHSGHGQLIRTCAGQSDHTVVSVFVNPTQFGPTEDFSKYPRTLEEDVRLATDCGASVVFAPDAQEVYPPGFSTTVIEKSFSNPLCGQFRPGHFEGVSTVVLRLLGLVKPDGVFFGLKDLQQFLVIKKLVSDLSLHTEIIGVPTVRETSGLAMSSRNKYLSEEEKSKSANISKELNRCINVLKSSASASLSQLSEFPTVHSGFSTSDGPLGEILKSCEERLSTEAGLKIQYLSLLKLPKVSGNIGGQYAIAVAGFQGSTRLIDNVIF